MDVFVIHLKTRVDREPGIEKLRLDYPNLQTFEPVPHETGYVSLSLTVRSILSQQMAERKEQCLIFEDDAVLLPGAKAHFEKCVEQLPENWQCLFGGAYHIIKPLMVAPNLVRAKEFGGTQMVLWNKPGMLKMLEHKPEEKMRPGDIDKWIMTKMVDTYICNPMVCKQSGSYSSIRPGPPNLDKRGNWLPTNVNN